MKIDMIGPWILLVVGLILVARAVFQKGLPSPQLGLFLLFGFLGLGLGVYGLEFMTKYGDWLDKIKEWIMDKPSEESYAKLFDSVGQGKMPKKLSELAVNFAINHPIAGTETVLQKKIEETPADKPGRSVLVNALKNYQAKLRTVDRLLEAAPTEQQIMQFDPETRFLMDHLKKKPLPK